MKASLLVVKPELPVRRWYVLCGDDAQDRKSELKFGEGVIGEEEERKRRSPCRLELVADDDAMPPMWMI